MLFFEAPAERNRVLIEKPIRFLLKVIPGAGKRRKPDLPTLSLVRLSQILSLLYFYEKQCLIVAFKTFQECYRFVYLLVHHNVFFNKRYLVAVGFQELFDVGG